MVQDYKDKSRCYECGEGGHLSYECPKNLVGSEPVFGGNFVKYHIIGAIVHIIYRVARLGFYINNRGVV